MRLVVVAAGFHRVRVLGRQHVPSKSRDAPVVVMAPHSTFFDAIAIVCLGAPSVVAKADTARLPFIGRRSMVAWSLEFKFGTLAVFACDVVVYRACCAASFFFVFNAMSMSKIFIFNNAISIFCTDIFLDFDIQHPYWFEQFIFARQKYLEHELICRIMNQPSPCY